jgi:phenylacetate-CoA ligase
LLADAARCAIGQAFGCPVVDLYGSDEAGCIAWECPECSGYHLAGDMLIVEVLTDGRPARPGERGEVVLTNLHSRAMPFIRYRLGDWVTLAAHLPRCGMPFPLIARVDGRSDDFIVLADGRSLPPHPFYHCIDPVPGVRRWRLTQDTRGRARLEVVAGEGFGPAMLRRILVDLDLLTAGGLLIETVMVPEIPVAPGAKFRTVRSRIESDRT